MRKRRYDVVVIGCGPGGATAGKFTALNGAETLILEEKRQIGFPIHDSMGIIYSKAEMEKLLSLAQKGIKGIISMEKRLIGKI